MSEMFDEDEGDLPETDTFSPEAGADAGGNTIVTGVISTLDARRRLENILEEKRLRDELDDFTDY